MYGLEQWAQGTSSFFVQHGTLINIATGLLVLGALAIKLFQNRLHFGAYPRVGWLTILLYTWAVSSIFWAVYREGLVTRVSLQYPYIITVVVLTPWLVYDMEDLKTGMMYMLAVGSLLVVLLALTVNWSYRGIELQGAMHMRGNPLAVASLGGYVCIISALMNFRGAARVWQILRWPALAFGIYLPIVSGSRGQLIGAVFVILVLLPFSRRFTNWKGFITSVFAVGLFGGIAAIAYEKFATGARWDPSEMLATYGDTRLAGSLTMLHAWLEAGPLRWLIGLGNSSGFAPWLLGKYPHFVSVEVLVDEGLIGISLFFTILVLSARSVLRIYPYVKEDPTMRGLVTSLAGLMLFDVILSCKQGSLLGSTYLFAFAIILGRLELYLRQAALAAQAQQVAADQTGHGGHVHTGLEVSDQ